MRHILLNRLDFKEIRVLETLSGFEYDKEQGVWASKNGDLLINHQNFSAVASKKKDIEIGEDQK